LSKASRTPTLFVFGRRRIDADACAASVTTLLGSEGTMQKAVMLYDVECVPPFRRH
jgi:hypothetical protein